MTIDIRFSDIFEIKADAMVNPANKQSNLYFGTHISEKIKKIVGKEVIEERKRIGTIALGECCYTSSGNLKQYRYIIHSATLDMYNLNPLFLFKLRQRVSDGTLKKLVWNTLDLADKLQLNSIVFPAIGTGIGAMSYKKCANIMLSTVLDFDNSTP